MADRTPDFERLLRTLVDHQVEFIVVGGVSAVLQGAPIMTLDLDVVHRRSPENIENLMRALEDLEAEYRGLESRRIVPSRSHLRSSGHQLLMTSHGPLDILGAIGAGRSYEDLLPLCHDLAVGDLTIRVLSLEALIQIKEEVGQSKDRAVLEILRETLRESSKGED